MSKLVFTERAWKEYLYWQEQSGRMIKRINAILKDIERNGNDGIGKPEPLRYQDGLWSRRNRRLPPFGLSFICRSD